MDVFMRISICVIPCNINMHDVAKKPFALTDSGSIFESCGSNFVFFSKASLLYHYLGI